MVKNKKDKVMVVFDADERQKFLKSKFGAKKLRKTKYLAEKEKKHKEELKQTKKEIKEARKEQIDKYNQILEQQQKVIDDIEAKKSKSSSFNMKAKAQSIKVTTTYL